MAWSSWWDRYSDQGGGDESNYPQQGSSGSKGSSDPYGMIGSSVGTGPLQTNNAWTWAYGSPSDAKNSGGSSSRGGSRGGSVALNPGGSNTTSYGSKTGGSETTTTVRFTMPKPEMAALPEMKMPEIDKRRIRALTQEQAAPGIRTLREGLQQAILPQTDNPNVRKMTVREALQGYGTGLEKVMGGAGTQARGEYQQEYQTKAQEQQANFQAQYQKVMTEYQAAMQAYLASAERTSKTVSQENTQQGTGTGTSGQWYRTQFGSLRWAPTDASGHFLPGTAYGGTY